jgi:formiminotetrahydrofolate cyclodeaminase
MRIYITIYYKEGYCRVCVDSLSCLLYCIIRARKKVITDIVITFYHQIYRMSLSDVNKINLLSILDEDFLSNVELLCID